jgi:hypothetical protein
MNDTSFLGLVQKAVLLLAVAFIFDVAASRWRTGQSSFWQALVGLALGAIGITVMLTPWTFGPGKLLRVPFQSPMAIINDMSERLVFIVTKILHSFNARKYKYEDHPEVSWPCEDRHSRILYPY